MAHPTADIVAADFAHSVGLLVRRLRAAAPSQELSWAESGVLKQLSKEGPATTADLARAAGMRPQSMRTILGTLEQMGMIKRRPHVTDGRQVNIELTAKGAATHRSTGDARRTWLAQAIAGLDRQQQQALIEAGRIMKQMVEGNPQ